MNARFSYRKPSSTWLVAGLVALLGFGFAAPARADDSAPAGDPVVIVAPDPTPIVVAPDPAPTTGTGTDSYIKGSDGTDSYIKGDDPTANPSQSPDSYIKG